jgi:hypothetical protein
MENNAKILVVIPIFRESISQLLSCLEKQTLKPAYIVIVAATRARASISCISRYRKSDLCKTSYARAYWS